MSFFSGAGGALIGGLAGMFGGSDDAPEVPGYIKKAGTRGLRVARDLYQFSKTPAMSTPQERAMLSGALAQQSEMLGAGREQLLGALGGPGGGANGGLSPEAQADALTRMRGSEESTQAMTSMLAHVNSLMARQQALGDAGRQFLGVAGLGSHTPQAGPQQNPLSSALANFAQIASYQQALKQQQAQGQPVAAQGGVAVRPPGAPGAQGNPMDPGYQMGQGMPPNLGLGMGVRAPFAG
jgi:hypothetical protein